MLPYATCIKVSNIGDMHAWVELVKLVNIVQRMLPARWHSPAVSIQEASEAVMFMLDHSDVC